MKKIIEIRAAEGGQDSKLFVNELALSYSKFATNKGWLIEYLTDIDNSGSNIIRLRISGNDIGDIEKEAGGHRIQRIPPTERKGRVHTSTVTVAIMDDAKPENDRINEKDIEIEWFNGTVGAGGQNHQKTQNCARVKHIPSGIVRTGQSRSRKNSLKIAMDALIEDVANISNMKFSIETNKERKSQIGSGMRGDKIRTYRFQEDQVTDHRSGTTCSIKKVLKGNFDLLWK